jgi:hypothetical protein
VGVVDLDDHRGEIAGSVTAQVEARRVEDVAEDPEVRDKDDPPAGRIDPLPREVAPDVGREVGCGHGQVIGVPEDRGVPAVPAEQAEAAIELVELVELERGVPDGVVEGVDDGARATMANAALEEVRVHAACSAAAPVSSSATSNPDRQPSSWNP